MQSVAFFVGKRPQVVWAWDLADRNLEFLRGFDVGYFGHVAKTEGQLLDTDERQYAAAAIRVAYGQALETLFALIAASAQAPECVVGWMLAYSNEDLRGVIEDLPRRALLKLAKATFSATPWDQEKQDRLAEGFARAWTRWTSEFLDERAQTEYNAFKHGTRASLGGFSVSIGEEQTAGAPAPPESMRPLGSSVFGSTFFAAERLEGRLHIYPRRTNRNWNTVGMANGLLLAALSIQNVVSYLRISNDDDPASCRFEAPEDDGAFEQPWHAPPGVTFSNMDQIVTREHIQPWTKDDVLARLSKRDPGR